MQVGAVDVEPNLGALVLRGEAIDQTPELGRVVHLDEVRDFVCGQIVEDEGGRE